MNKHITLKRARKALRIAVDVKGHDFVYNTAGAGLCAYSAPGGVRNLDCDPVVGCGVGAALRVLGMTVDELRVMDNADDAVGIGSICLPGDWTITDKARDYLGTFQNLQDNGDTWGEALSVAESSLG